MEEVKKGRAVSKGRKTPYKLEEKLVENLVELQKVHTNLAEKFDKLSDQISSLLALFEMAARTFAKQPAVLATEKDKEFLDKLDKLLEQNKTIAKAITMMEEKVRERVYGMAHEEEEKKKEEELMPSIGRPLPKF